ncbi:hypothetical protein JB92DRAFT_3103574 [Gautieria morchelliformis]|nr:hypothetical protein JB92DRAFT_3103574 [Gautieria morchelliformis]
MASLEPTPSVPAGNICSGRGSLQAIGSPHLTNYIRELEVRVDANHWTREGRSVDPDQSRLAAALRRLSKLQSIELYDLEMGKLTVDLCQSLRWVLLLPSLTSLKYCIGQHGNINFLQDLLTRGDQEDDEPRERSHLSHLNLDLEMEGNLDLYVDWVLGPRSPFEISHIDHLRINLLTKKDEKALNTLFRTIGGSLNEVALGVPYHGLLYPKLAFDIKLEYNSNIRFLSLNYVSIGTLRPVDLKSFGIAWLLRFLSNFDASNKIEHIDLQLVILDIDTFREVCSAAIWGQVDCILAKKFLKPEEVVIREVLATSADPEVYSEFEECMLHAFPLLVERGVDVDVRSLLKE